MMMPLEASARPVALDRVSAEAVVMLDVRDELRAGREPFSLIMEALSRVPPHGAFAVRAIFEPVPLYRVLGRHGFEHWTECAAPDDWTVWFYRPESDLVEALPAHDGAAAAASLDADGGAAGDVVVLDVRGLEPPEPMLRTLAALEQLATGGTLVQLNVRVPQFLLPLLEERGFSYQVREQDASLVRVFIRHRTP